MQYEVYKIINGIEKPLAYYNNLEWAEDMCKRLNGFNPVYFVKIYNNLK